MEDKKTSSPTGNIGNLSNLQFEAALIHVFMLMMANVRGVLVLPSTIFVLIDLDFTDN